MSDIKQKFKIILVGDGGVGKTTYMQRHIGVEFERKYLPTVGLNKYQLTRNTSRGDIEFDVWDNAGQEKFGWLRDDYYANADAAIIMFDVTRSLTYKNILNWYNEIRRVCGNIPIVIAGNKCDELEREVRPKQITIPQKLGIPYYDISVKSCYNYDKPFTYLEEQLMV